MSESLRILIPEGNPADAELVQFELEEAGIVFTGRVISILPKYKMNGVSVFNCYIPGSPLRRIILCTG